MHKTKYKSAQAQGSLTKNKHSIATYTIRISNGQINSSSGGDVNKCDDDGTSPMLIAAQKGHAAVTNLRYARAYVPVSAPAHYANARVYGRARNNCVTAAVHVGGAQ